MSLKAGNSRPVVELSRSQFEIILTMLAVAGLVAQVAAAAYYWSRLPEKIPMHFDIHGRPDRWGSPWTILWLPATTAVIVAGLSVLERFPHAYNYPWPITAENAARQYALARGMLVALKAVIAWLFLGILVGTCHAALTGGNLNPWIPGLGVATVFAVVGVYFFLAARAR